MSANLNKEIISLFSGQSSILTVPRLYVQLTKNHSLALVLNQCVFWSNKSSLKDGWFYKPYIDWFEEIQIPERTLRRRFEKLAANGWIETKIKMVNGLNVLHVKPDMDKIVASISNVLEQNHPSRPLCQNGTNIELNTCTNIAPAGQLGRTESATLADPSIYTDNKTQKKLTNCLVSSVFFNQLVDQKILEQKLETDPRSDEEFMSDAVEHVDKYSNPNYPRLQRAYALVKLLKNLKENNQIFQVAGRVPIGQTPTGQLPTGQKEKSVVNRGEVSTVDSDQTTSSTIPEFTEEQKTMAADYKHAVKFKMIEEIFPDPDQRESAKALYEVRYPSIVPPRPPKTELEKHVGSTFKSLLGSMYTHCNT